MHPPRSAHPNILPSKGAARLHFPAALVCGDMAVLLLVTMLGFMTHGETLSLRLFTTFLPLCAAWALVSPWLGLFRPEIYRRAKVPAPSATLVWRAALAMVLAAPLAALLRALWLQSAQLDRVNAPIIPTFVIALGFSAAVGMSLWRLGWAWWSSRRGDHGG